MHLDSRKVDYKNKRKQTKENVSLRPDDIETTLVQKALHNQKGTHKTEYTINI